MIDEFDGFLAGIAREEHRSRTRDVLTWVGATYPRLTPVVKWNQPMFTDHSTFIIGFSVAKKHLAFTPEQKTLALFRDRLEAGGYEATSMIARIRWDAAVPYDLLAEMIEFNIDDKKNVRTFWRTPTD